MRSPRSLLLLAAAGVLTAASANAQTTCPVACTAIGSPVCASDGQTYGNECEFEVAKCQSGDASLAIVSTGACPSASTSSSSSGSVSCAEEFVCLEIYDPVCGSDGVTYGNSCELKFAQCTDASITQASTGECGSSSASAGVGGDSSVDVGDGSDVRSASAECSTVCTREYEPVCGSDGVTYGNSCLFDNAQCLDASLSVASDGVCADASTSSASSSASSSSSSSSSSSAPANTGSTALLLAVIAISVAL